MSPRMRVENALVLVVVGNRFAEIKPGGSARHGGILREQREGQTRASALFPGRDSPRSRALSHSGFCDLIIVQRYRGLRPRSTANLRGGRAWQGTACLSGAPPACA